MLYAVWKDSNKKCMNNNKIDSWSIIFKYVNENIFLPLLIQDAECTTYSLLSLLRKENNKGSQ